MTKQTHATCSTKDPNYSRTCDCNPSSKERLQASSSESDRRSEHANGGEPLRLTDSASFSCSWQQRDPTDLLLVTPLPRRPLLDWRMYKTQRSLHIFFTSRPSSKKSNVSNESQKSRTGKLIITLQKKMHSHRDSQEQAVHSNIFQRNNNKQSSLDNKTQKTNQTPNTYK